MRMVTFADVTIRGGRNQSGGGIFNSSGTVTLVDIWVYTPFIMILLLAGLRSLPKAPFEAAALDGVPRNFVFFRITLPMLMPYMITAALFRLLGRE